MWQYSGQWEISWSLGESISPLTEVLPFLASLQLLSEVQLGCLLLWQPSCNHEEKAKTQNLKDLVCDVFKQMTSAAFTPTSNWMIKQTNKQKSWYVLKSHCQNFCYSESSETPHWSISTEGGALQAEEMTKDPTAGMSVAGLGTERRPARLEYSRHGGKWGQFSLET